LLTTPKSTWPRCGPPCGGRRCQHYSWGPYLGVCSRARRGPARREPRGGQRSDTGAPRACLLRQRVRAGLGDLCILLRGGTGDADRPNNLTVDHEWNPALKGTRTGESQQPEVGTALAAEILEPLRRTPVEDRRVRLVLGRFDVPAGTGRPTTCGARVVGDDEVSDRQDPRDRRRTRSGRRSGHFAPRGGIPSLRGADG